jgi:actin-related protein
VTPCAVREAACDAAQPGQLLHPIQGGVVRNWDALESLYHHIFYEQARRRASPLPLCSL